MLRRFRTTCTLGAPLAVGRFPEHGWTFVHARRVFTGAWFWVHEPSSYETTLAPDPVVLPAHASKRTPGTGVAGVFVVCAVRSEICSEALEPDQNKNLTPPE